MRSPFTLCNMCNTRYKYIAFTMNKEEHSITLTYNNTNTTFALLTEDKEKNYTIIELMISKVQNYNEKGN